VRVPEASTLDAKNMFVAGMLAVSGTSSWRMDNAKSGLKSANGENTRGAVVAISGIVPLVSIRS